MEMCLRKGLSSGASGVYESELGEILGTRAVLRVTGGDNNGLCCDATRPSPGFRWVGKGLGVYNEVATNLGSDGEGGLGILARAEGRRGEWGRKGGMEEGRVGRVEGVWVPPRRGWRLSENGDGRLLNRSKSQSGKTSKRYYQHIHRYSTIEVHNIISTSSSPQNQQRKCFLTLGHSW